METIKEEFPTNVWWDFDLFFTDGPILNVGSDFGLVPSLFEPGGLVQQEYLVMDTPVICSRTGGLKDTVVDIRDKKSGQTSQKLKPNGLLFSPGNVEELSEAILDAYQIYSDHLIKLDQRCNSNNQDQTLSVYEILVQNSFDSVVDVETMAIKYLEEFHRIKNSIFIPNYNIQIDYLFRQVKQNINESNRKMFLKKQVSFEGDFHRKILLKIDAYDIIEHIQQFQTTSVSVLVYVEGEQPFTRMCKFNKIYKDYVFDVFPDLLALEKKSSEIKNLELKYYFRVNKKRTVVNSRLAVAYDRQIGMMVNVLDLALVFKSKQ